MSENTNLNITLEAFAKIVIEEWEKKIEALGIGYSWQLIDSLYHHIHTNADGDPTKIEFTFNWYGMMVDYGVGNGVNLEDRDSMIVSGSTSRRPKPWYTDVFYKQLERLRHILAEKTARQIENMIVINAQTMSSSNSNQQAAASVRRDASFWKRYAAAKGR